MLAARLGGECHLVHSVAHFVNVECSSDGFVIKHDIDSDLAPARLGSVHGKGEGFPGLGSSGGFLVGDL